MSMLLGKNFSTGMSLFVPAAGKQHQPDRKVLSESLKSNDLSVLSTAMLVFWRVSEKTQTHLPYIFYFGSDKVVSLKLLSFSKIIFPELELILFSSDLSQSAETGELYHIVTAHKCFLHGPPKY